MISMFEDDELNLLFEKIADKINKLLDEKFMAEQEALLLGLNWDEERAAHKITRSELEGISGRQYHMTTTTRSGGENE